MGEGHSTSGGVDAGMGDMNIVSMMCWNVAGWSKDGALGSVRSVGRHDFRAKVISGYNPDIACIVETWLREGEEVEFEDYNWVAHNRGQLNKNAVRGSGGVGLLVKHTMYRSWSVEVVNIEIEDVMWVKFAKQEVNEVFFVAVCYISLAGSSRDVDTEERFLMLSEQIQSFGLEGRVIVCGDFNARCGVWRISMKR